MPAMMVHGAMRLGDLVDSVCGQGAVCSRGERNHDGEYPLVLELPTGKRAVVFTSDLDVIVGPDIVKYVENMLGLKVPRL